MKQIKNKNNGIVINGNSINTLSNSISYEIIIPLEDISYAVTTFPFINGVAQLNGEFFNYTGDKHISNLPDIMLTNYVETTDVGKSGTEIMKNFSASILFLTNVLELNMDEWELI